MITQQQKESAIKIKTEQFVFETKKIKEAVANIARIQKEDPFGYEQQKNDLHKGLLSLKVSEYRQAIELYKKQNPIKYEQKKDEMQAALAKLESEYNDFVGNSNPQLEPVMA